MATPKYLPRHSPLPPPRTPRHDSLHLPSSLPPLPPLPVDSHCTLSKHLPFVEETERATFVVFRSVYLWEGVV